MVHTVPICMILIVRHAHATTSEQLKDFQQAQEPRCSLPIKCTHLCEAPTHTLRLPKDRKHLHHIEGAKHGPHRDTDHH